ncbi:MAG: hypothetical protein V1906_01935 [Candidatus Woesearchaeota archaeon]
MAKEDQGDKEETEEEDVEEDKEEPKKKASEKQERPSETKQKLMEIAGSTASGLKTGVVALAKLIIVIVMSFLKALTINFYNNIKENWGKIYKKNPEKAEVKKKKK